MRLTGWAFLAVLAIGVERYVSNVKYEGIDISWSPGWGNVCSFIHENVKEKRIVACGSDKFFPLYGEKFTNKVFLFRGKGSASDLMNFRPKQACQLRRCVCA